MTCIMLPVFCICYPNQYIDPASVRCSTGDDESDDEDDERERKLPNKNSGKQMSYILKHPLHSKLPNVPFVCQMFPSYAISCDSKTVHGAAWR